MRLVLSFLAIVLVSTPVFAGGSPREQAAAGAKLFASSGCAHCHGDNLQGNDIGPDLRGVGRQLKPAEIYAQIHNGGKAMPAFGDVFTNEQIEQLVAYLRTERARVPEPKPASSTPGGAGRQ